MFVLLSELFVGPMLPESYVCPILSGSQFVLLSGSLFVLMSAIPLFVQSCLGSLFVLLSKSYICPILSWFSVYPLV